MIWMLIKAFLIGFIVNLGPFALMNYLASRKEESKVFAALCMLSYCVACLTILGSAFYFMASDNGVSLGPFFTAIIGALTAHIIFYFKFVLKRKIVQTDLMKFLIGLISIGVLFVILLGPLAVYNILSGVGLDGPSPNVLVGAFILILSGSIGAVAAIWLYGALLKLFALQTD